jgi:NADPH-dependent glutamate synthase beta subunit-like oxidoreductase
MSAARERDLTPLPDLVHDGPFAGPVRTRRPVYVDLLPPCNNACPAGEDIQGWLAAVGEKDYAGAFDILTRDNPLPAVMGRVCYHPCEDACNRCEFDDAVSIHAVERFIGDEAARTGRSFEITARGAERGQAGATAGNSVAPAAGTRVLVIGAGPSGLSAAYHLARRGHQVEIRDAGGEPGGMMRYGIPAYRLPREVLAADIARIERLGVTFTMNHNVTDLEAERQGFDAIFVAVGAHLSKHAEIPAKDATRIIDAVPFLRDVAAGGQPVLGRRVAVYGGGNTAMDAARTAKRLGADDTLIVYRRNREKMPAHEEEAAAAETEGVTINWLRTISGFDGPAMTVEVMELDESGYPRPTGRVETLEADTLILALGQDADTTFLRQVPGVTFSMDGTVAVDGQMMTGCPGVFAGGDMVPAERTVTVSVGHGKKAARAIDAYLRGITQPGRPKHELAEFGKLHPWYFAESQHHQGTERAVASRTTSFAEVVGGLTEDAAVSEAARCLSCGNCFECDGCLGSCPEDAVIKLGPGLRYEFDYQRCTGCGTCYDQCPVHAIDLFAAAGPAADEFVFEEGARS